MSFALLLAKIESPALKTLALHWQEARGTKQMPAWRDINPARIARQLPDIWSWKYDPAIDDFIGRLVGENINQTLGESIRGKRASEFFRNRGGSAMIDRARRVIAEPCYFHSHGSVYANLARHVEGERIILPLAEDGWSADSVLGMTVYQMPGQQPEGMEQILGDQGEFIPL
ncbi:MAG: PAS domain-containing protein [Rhizobiales bacterium]|nr:PAS domain-containing protein [Hyphomicrobiales bacterium]